MAEEQFLFDTEQGVIFDIKGTEDRPLSEEDKQEITERLQKFSETPEAKEQFKTLKKFVVSGFTIFAFNIMIMPLNIVIPINLFTICFTTVFGLLSLPFFSIIIMFFI